MGYCKGFSIAGHWIEVYKNKEKTNTKKIQKFKKDIEKFGTT